MLKLHITNLGTGEFRSLTVDLSSGQNRCSIGRFPASDLLLIDPNVSRLHAFLQLSENRYMLVDCESTGGTLLNGNRIEGNRGYVLSNGDKIRLGEFSITVELVIQKTTPPPVTVMRPQGINPIRMPVLHAR